MAAVQRQLDFDFDVAPDADDAESIAETIPTTIARTSPFRSPALDLQETLAKRLQEPKAHSRKDVAFGLITGIIGATWVTGMLIYATL